VSGCDAIVGQLWLYPVKSFRGEQLDELSLDSRGVVGDRTFAVRDLNGRFGSGKTTRRFRFLRDLSDFSAKIEGSDVVVSAPSGDAFRVGDSDLDKLLTVRYGEPLAVLQEEAVSHFDAAPVHLLTTSSLRWVEAEHGQTSGDTRRYRPNIVLDTGGSGLVEESWLGASLSIGSCVLRVSKGVERCVMPTYHQDELEHAPGLLRFLALRNNTSLGVYAEVTVPGTIKLGDPVTVHAR
jgi:MOSC domain-containing protein